MVQTYKDGDALDALATRTAMRTLRALFRSAPRAMSSSELARELATSRSSIKRALPRLNDLGLVRSRERGQLVLHGIRSSSPLVGPLFEMFNHERYLSVRADIREVLDRIMAGVDTTGLSCVLLFGSQAKGTAGEVSDIDMCFVWRGRTWDEGFQPMVRDLASPYILVEPHCYSQDDFRKVPDLVVLDSILFGISLHGHRFLLSTRHDLESIRKEVLLARLDGCRRILEQATLVVGAAKEHFEAIVEVGLTEIEMVLHHGVTVPRSVVRDEGRFEARIDVLTREIAREEDLIRVT